uniref:Uncharacterized protein n=1 Tax=Physcomitrium patens TaxID=3218 RepID=A0A2K1KBX3_PHYPA|nr:hypothetical protein PHYPA_010458 [Physcomitrium patens]
MFNVGTGTLDHGLAVFTVWSHQLTCYGTLPKCGLNLGFWRVRFHSLLGFEF